ncbi:MAG: Gfo/Idh/MocA family oxidoreductase, partial [Pirellulales bacterium]
MAFGFGIVGCGMISQFHARAIADVRGARLVACCDTRSESADRFAAANGCKSYHSLDDMLADKRVDVVTIATPSGLHMVPAVAAAKAGKHVIVEKPLEVTLKKCDRIIRECEKNGVQLAT